MNFYHSIKKYIFLLACVFTLSLALHIVFVYLYEGATAIPERGGSFSIGLIGSAANTDPTQFTLDYKSDFVLKFLYRGLLHYNTQTQAMEGDLANCDLSKLGEIRCNFKGNANWSDGTKITLDDVLATYSLLAETGINKQLQANLSRFAITRENDSIVFRTSAPSLENVELLTLPIIQKAGTEQLRTTGKLDKEVYSGNYQIDKRESDTVHGSENIVLTANSTAPKDQGYSRIIFKYYQDEKSLFDQKDGLNFIYPDYYDTEDGGSRFTEGTIETPDFVGAFLNTERLKPEARSLISKIVAGSISDDNELTPVKNPFFTDTVIAPTLPETLKNPAKLDAELQKIGYYRKSALTALNEIANPAATVSLAANTALPSASSSTTSTPVTSTTAQPAASIAEAPKTEAPIINSLVPLHFFDTPSKNDKFALASTNEVEIGGNVPSGVTGVFINSYRLKSFATGNTRFIYRARTDLGNLKLGTNTYALAFEQNGVKVVQESLELHMTATKAEADALWATWTAPKSHQETAGGNTIIQPSATPTTIGSQATGSIMSMGSGNTISNTGGTSPISVPAVPNMSLTGAKQASSESITNTGETRISESDKELSKKEKKGEDPLLYLKSGEPAKLVIKTISPRSEILSASNKIVTAFKDLGFTVEFEEIDSSAASLSETKKASSKNYDILITGVNLGYMGTYISPYFHSGQAQNGYNFGLLRNPNLDIILEELSSHDMTAENRLKDYEKVNAILAKENVIVPVGTTPLTYFVDKIVRDFSVPIKLPGAVYVESSIKNSYLKRSYVIDFKQKSVSGFIDWCEAKIASPKQ